MSETSREVWNSKQPEVLLNLVFILNTTCVEKKIMVIRSKK